MTDFSELVTAFRQKATQVLENARTSVSELDGLQAELNGISKEITQLRKQIGKQAGGRGRGRKPHTPVPAPQPTAVAAE